MGCFVTSSVLSSSVSLRRSAPACPPARPPAALPPPLPPPTLPPPPSAPLPCPHLVAAAVMSAPLAEACNELVTSVVLGSDVVSAGRWGSRQQLACWQERGPVGEEQHRTGQASPTKSLPPVLLASPSPLPASLFLILCLLLPLLSPSPCLLLPLRRCPTCRTPAWRRCCWRPRRPAPCGAPWRSGAASWRARW